VGRDGVRYVLRLFGRRVLRVAVQDEAMGAVLDFLEQVHLAGFYLFDKYLEIPKRLLGLRYVRTSYSPRGTPTPKYDILGLLLVAQLLVLTLVNIRPFLSLAAKRGLRTAVVQSLAAQDLSQPDLNLHDGEDVITEDALCHSTKTCTLCLTSMNQPTATQCGHVFCWSCIASWCAKKDACPLCRQPIESRQLICLYHY